MTNAVSRLDELADGLLSFDLSKPRFNLSALGVHHSVEPDTKPSFIVRNAEPHETRLVAPGTKGVYEDMLSRLGVHNTTLSTDADAEFDANEFEVFYNKTVDLADICELAEINDRLETIANNYQEFTRAKDDLTQELKKYTVKTKIGSKQAKFDAIDKELKSAKEQYEALYREIEDEKQLVDRTSQQLMDLLAKAEVTERTEAEVAEIIEQKRKELAELRMEIDEADRELDGKNVTLEATRPQTVSERLQQLKADILRSQAQHGGRRGSYDNDPRVIQFKERLQQMVGEFNDLDYINQSLERMYINTIDTVAKGDIEFSSPVSAETERTTRRLSLATVLSPQQRILCGQLLCLLYDYSQAHNNTSADESKGTTGMPEMALRNELQEFAQDHGIRSEQVSQILYNLYGKRLIEVDRTTRDHLVKTTWK